MKKIIWICFLFLLADGGKITAQENELSWMKNGTRLRYQLHNYGSDYEFIVDIKKAEKEINFDWWMTRPGNRDGSIIITPEAMENAVVQKNYFSGGDEKIDDRTTVWVSRKVWKALHNKEKIIINPDGYDEELSFISDEDYEIIINGKKTKVKTLYAETSKGSKFWIFDNPDFPLILKMAISFNIEIIEILTKGEWEK